MRIIPKNTKVSTEFFKGVTLADMIVGFMGVLVIFLIVISSLPHRGYIALGFGFVLAFLLVRIDDEANYMFLFRIIRHFSYYRSYRKPGFEYPVEEAADEEIQEDVQIENIVAFEEAEIKEFDTVTPEMSFDIPGDMLVLENDRAEELVFMDDKAEKPVFMDNDTENPTGLEKNTPLDEHSLLRMELEEEGFEVLNLDEETVELETENKPVDTYAGMKNKAPQSVWNSIRNKSQKANKGDY